MSHHIFIRTAREQQRGLGEDVQVGKEEGEDASARRMRRDENSSSILRDPPGEDFCAGDLFAHIRFWPALL